MTWQAPIIPHKADHDELVVMGIDPGLSGALAFYRPSENYISTFDMPRVRDEIDAHELASIIAEYSPTVSIIERVGPMPRDGVRQAWRFSAANSVAKTVCALMNVPMTMVPASVWKAAMKLPGGKDGKEKSRLMALQLFPASAEEFSRKKDAGRAEAALIAYWASQKFIYDGKVKS